MQHRIRNQAWIHQPVVDGSIGAGFGFGSGYGFGSGDGFGSGAIPTRPINSLEKSP